MQKHVEERVKEVANYILLTKATIRKTAKVFGVSKSTIGKDLSERLLELNPKLYSSVKKIKDCNLLERSFRGGYANAQKYKNMYN